MEEFKCRGYAGDVPVYCAHDKIVPVAEVKPNPKNPNHHPEEQIELLAKIIKTQGWRAPITVSTRSGLVVRGHGRLIAAKFLGLEFVPIDFQHYKSNDAELADLLADNKIAELAEIDSKMLAEVFKDIDPDAIDIDITGYNEEEYKSITAALTEAVKEPELKGPDAEVAPPKVPTSKLGDIWLLGNHRLMCGDSTDKETVEMLMDGNKADMVMTDPPYGMFLDTDYSKMSGDEGCGKKYDKVIGDNEDFDPLLIKTIFDNFSYVKEMFLWGADYYAEHIKDKNKGTWFVWDKRENELTEKNVDNRFGSMFELCWSKEKHRREIVRFMWAGMMKQADFDGGRNHPTQKPAKMLARFIENFSINNNLVVDLYGGSGSTLIACEQLDRTCYMMELDPKYCDVIVRRYMQVTGKTDVVLVRDGTEVPVEKTGIMD